MRGFCFELIIFELMYEFAIIGCGNIARLHAEQISRLGKLSAVCDPDKEKADRLASEFKAKAYYSFEEVLSDPSIDIFCICTPNGYHAEHCIRALQAGRHVFCEAPLCLTRAGAWQIIETEKFCRKKLFVFNASTAHPAATELKTAIKEHTNGHLYRFDLHCVSKAPADHYQGWRGKIFPGGGALYTDFSNYIDLLISLFGEIDSVKGTSANHDTGLVEFEDEGVATVRTVGGIEGTIRWKLGADPLTGPAFSISGLKKPMIFSAGELSAMVAADAAFYERSYVKFLETLENGGSSSAGLYQSTRTIEGIERIYKAVSPNSFANL
ncbi:MAG TPA: Gfo/Idh/MocA family oxidoreductase [Flavisolibacter sp.]|nr:Gfo/Idh/MocA family oxidoreductase [Flavisolibacter sp.]